MVALLLVGPMISSGTWLLHAHDSNSSHGHRLSGGAMVADAALAVAWHAEVHVEPVHGGEHTHDAEPMPAGQLIEVPSTPLRGPSVASTGAEHVSNLLAQSASFPVEAVVSACHEVRDTGEDPPRGGACSSGALRVLRSSHALRI